MSEKWMNWVLVAIIVFLVFLNISAYNAVLDGFKNLSLFFAGLILIVFAAFFHVYRFGMSKAMVLPPPPPKLLSDEKPSALQAPKERETPQLSDSTSSIEEKEATKEIQEVPKAQVKADVGLDQQHDPNIGTSDLNKP